MPNETIRPRLLLVAGLLLPACWLLPAPAHACTPPMCFNLLVAPSGGQAVPANVSGFPFTPAHGTYVVGGVTRQPAQDPNGLMLLDAANQVVATKLVKLSFGEDYALVPDAALAEGAYHFRRYGAACNSSEPVDGGTGAGDGGSVVFADFGPFTVGPAVSIPTSAGTVVAGPPRFWPAGQMPVPDRDGICGPYLPPVSMVYLGWTPTAEMAAWRAVAKFQVTVDGAEWTTTDWNPPKSDIYRRHHDTLFTACGEDPSWPGHADLGVPEGTHTATLMVWLPNQATPIPAEPFTFTTSCATGVGLDAGAGSDAADTGLDTSIGAGGAPGRGGATGSAGGGGASAQGGAVGTTETADSSGCGCHVASPSRWNGAGAVFLVLAIALAARRRRPKS